MEKRNKEIEDILFKLDILLKKQDSFTSEIAALKQEISILKASKKSEKESEDVFEQNFEAKTVSSPNIQKAAIPKPVPIFEPRKSKFSINKSFEWEKFIGENLINKIGIAITIIGVAIGAKYSIEHELISPLTRIILGYVMGLSLLGFGIKLKQKYESYSAVLVSGSIAIMYFITYSAYSFYGLFPQLLAFALMLVFTVFTVVAAINYNKQVIGLIGLVGAYAVPFLLSEGSGKVAVLFTYITIVNAGILFLAFKKYWKWLYYTSFVLTWLIYGVWFSTKYLATTNFTLALVFIAIFFVTFYLIFLAYKLLRKEKYDVEAVILLLVNSFIFYGFGYAILSSTANSQSYLGLFTLLNAIIHFTVASIVYKQKLADKNLFYLVAGLVLVFITITFPVQLNGNWVTIIWAFEAALLFWIGRTKAVTFYEKLSYLLMYLSFFSLLQDWIAIPTYYAYQGQNKIIPILNVYFLTGVLFVAAFAFINKLLYSPKYASALIPKKKITTFISYSVSAILLFALYWIFRIEIERYWSQLYYDSLVEIKNTKESYTSQYYNYDFKNFESIWAINYSLIFFSFLTLFNIIKIRNKKLAYITLVFNLCVLLAFLAQGLYVLSELRDSYINQINAQYYKIGVFNIGIRYISYLFGALLIFCSYQYLKQNYLQKVSKNLKIVFDAILYISIIWALSSELITWLSFSKVDQSYKLGLSILWGVYALFLIALGISKKQKHLRIGAIALFSVTLIKLFFYDISQMETIAKTVIFVALGVLLLIISFLYNKYKHIIAHEIEN